MLDASNGMPEAAASDCVFLPVQSRPDEISKKHRPVGGLRKRTFDLISAVIVLLCISPLFLLISAAIKLIEGGPVAYRHRRLGFDGSEFECFKFRTMANNSEELLRQYLASNRQAALEWERTHKLKDDPRITSLGIILRKTSLDELPQIFNIIKGEMSFVGPRPIVGAEVPKYGASIRHYLDARPGLTGKWQVSGRNDVNYETRVALDREYVEAWSFREDIKILVKTVGVVLGSRGCY